MPRNLSGRLTTGGTIVLIGLLLLLSTTGLVTMRSVWGWVAALFVVIGAWSLISSGFRNLVGPVMVITIAGTFLLRNLGILPDGVIGTWWPLFVVLFGVLIMISRSRRRQRVRLEGIAASDEMTVVSIFGTNDRRITTSQFAGAEVIIVFGEAELDLRDVTLGPGTGVVELISVFGEAELRVPSEWNVRLDMLTVLGDTTDRRPRQPDTADATSESDLIVTGVCAFSNVQIRD